MVSHSMHRHAPAAHAATSPGVGVFALSTLFLEMRVALVQVVKLATVYTHHGIHSPWNAEPNTLAFVAYDAQARTIIDSLPAEWGTTTISRQLTTQADTMSPVLARAQVHLPQRGNTKLRHVFLRQFSEGTWTFSCEPFLHFIKVYH